MLRCRGLVRHFGPRAVLDGLDLEVESGESVAIVGPSGSGKTTLLNCIAGLDRLDAGRVEIDGRRVDDLSASGLAAVRRRSIGLVFQFGELFDELTVAENVGLPLRLNGDSDPQVVSDVLGSVGLGTRARSWPAELSGGERQRVAIARAIVGRPHLVLADEPTGALDEDLSHVICDLLVARAADVGAALVVVTHDPLVRERMRRAMRVERGRLVPE